MRSSPGIRGQARGSCHGSDLGQLIGGRSASRRQWSGSAEHLGCLMQSWRVLATLRRLFTLLRRAERRIEARAVRSIILTGMIEEVAREIRRDQSRSAASGHRTGGEGPSSQHGNGPPRIGRGRRSRSLAAFDTLSLAVLCRRPEREEAAWLSQLSPRTFWTPSSGFAYPHAARHGRILLRLLHGDGRCSLQFGLAGSPAGTCRRIRRFRSGRDSGPDDPPHSFCVADGSAMAGSGSTPARTQKQ